MKRLLIISCAILLFFPGSMLLAQGNAGIGLQLGEPTGLSLKFWTTRSNAVDAVIGWNMIANKFTAQAGYLWHFPQPVASGSFALYAGVGGILGGGSNRNTGEGEFLLGARVPLGLEYIYRAFGFYAQLDPRVNLLPAIGLGLGGGIGIRFYP
jgi:hypothetical protein